MKIKRIKVYKNPHRAGGVASGTCIVHEYHQRKGKLVYNPEFKGYLKRAGSGKMTEIKVKKIKPLEV